MKKKAFLSILNKTIKKNLNENDELDLDSLNILQIIEMNNITFKGFKLNNAKLLKCTTVKDLFKLYKDKIS